MQAGKPRVPGTSCRGFGAGPECTRYAVVGGGGDGDAPVPCAPTKERRVGLDWPLVNQPQPFSGFGKQFEGCLFLHAVLYWYGRLVARILL